MAVKRMVAVVVSEALCRLAQLVSLNIHVAATNTVTKNHKLTDELTETDCDENRSHEANKYANLKILEVTRSITPPGKCTSNTVQQRLLRPE